MNRAFSEHILHRNIVLLQLDVQLVLLLLFFFSLFVTMTADVDTSILIQVSHFDQDYLKMTHVRVGSIVAVVVLSVIASAGIRSNPTHYDAFSYVLFTSNSSSSVSASTGNCTASLQCQLLSTSMPNEWWSRLVSTSVSDKIKLKILILPLDKSL